MSFISLLVWKAFPVLFWIVVVWIWFGLIELLLTLHPSLVIHLPSFVYFISPYLRINLCVHPSKICHSLRSLWVERLFSLDLIWFDSIMYCALCILYWLSPCLLVYFISRSLRINLVSVRLSSVSWSVGGSSYTGRW